MSEDIEFEGGFLDEAGIDVSKIADDPFGFGNDYWPVAVIEVGAVKLTANKDKLGMMVKFAVDHERYQGTMVSKGLGNGVWYQIPVPEHLRNQIPWNPEGETEQTAMYKLKTLFRALGFRADEMGGVNGQKMLGRRALSKIKPVLEENGFWKFNLNAMKPLGEDSAATAHQSGPTNSGKTAAQLAEEELKREMGED